jgi:nucleotide-binding universal stress UspA family protein
MIAVDYAANLAKKVSGEIYLLHVLQAGEVDTSMGTIGSWAGAEGVETVPSMMARLKLVKRQMVALIADRGLTNMNVQDFIEVGEPYMKINAAAEKYSADIILMGTHGISGLKELFIGSVSEKVVQHASRPVLAVKSKRSLSPSNIIFASDFKEEAHRIFEFVKNFAAIFNATIHLLKVVDSDSESVKAKSREAIHAFAQRHSTASSAIAIVHASKVEEGIQQFVKQIDGDLIVIGTHGRNGLARFFNGSVSEELVNHADCPVLTVNFREGK